MAIRAPDGANKNTSTQKGSLCLYFDSWPSINLTFGWTTGCTGRLSSSWWRRVSWTYFDFLDFWTNPQSCMFPFGIFSTKYSKILHLLRNKRRPNLKVKVRVRSKPNLVSRLTFGKAQRKVGWQYRVSQKGAYRTCGSRWETRFMGESGPKYQK